MMAFKTLITFSLGVVSSHYSRHGVNGRANKYRVFCYLVSYSAFVALVLIADGYTIFKFNLEESVLGFLVGSTAASAIGLVLAVTTGLFRPLK